MNSPALGRAPQRAKDPLYVVVKEVPRTEHGCPARGPAQTPRFLTTRRRPCKDLFSAHLLS